MCVQERELIATLIEPNEIKTGVHQAQEKFPDLNQHPCDFDRDFEEIDLCDFPWAVNQRDEDLRRLAPLLSQLEAHSGGADAKAFCEQLAMKARARDALLGCGARAPLVEQFINARGDLAGDGLGTWLFFHTSRSRHVQVLGNGVATEAKVPGRLTATAAFDQDLVTNDMNLIHSEHPFLQ